MNEGSRKTVLVIGAIAAAAGIAFTATQLLKRNRSDGGQRSLGSRSVSDLLTDCYDKMREIQDHLSQLSASTLPNPAVTK